MNLFDQLVEEVLARQPQLSPLRTVVEKELLQYDILRILSQQRFLANLTFMGGTCLRCCYGAIRLSEDLDFTGGQAFTREDLLPIGPLLTENLQRQYGLQVDVSEPTKDTGNVDTWKIKVTTPQADKHIPAQRIHLDICAVPSYERKPMLMLNLYGVDRGTSGLVVQAQSREEIYADKLLAFALRPNRIKYRDVWDIAWLHQQGLKPRFALVPQKLRDHRQTPEHFLDLFKRRKQLLTKNTAMMSEFQQEMRRFLPVDQTHHVIEGESFWGFVTYLMEDLERQMEPFLLGTMRE